MIFSIASGLFLVVLLLIRSKKQKPFITNKFLNTSILILSLLLILSGVSWFLMLLFSASSFAEGDKAIGLFLFGIALAGLIAETPNEKPKKKHH